MTKQWPAIANTEEIVLYNVPVSDLSGIYFDSDCSVATVNTNVPFAKAFR